MIDKRRRDFDKRFEEAERQIDEAWQEARSHQNEEHHMVIPFLNGGHAHVTFSGHVTEQGIRNAIELLEVLARQTAERQKTAAADRAGQ